MKHKKENKERPPSPNALNMHHHQMNAANAMAAAMQQFPGAAATAVGFPLHQFTFPRNFLLANNYS